MLNLNDETLNEFHISGFTQTMHNIPDVSANDVICGLNVTTKSVQTHTLDISKSPPINILGNITVPFEELAFPWLLPNGENGFTNVKFQKSQTYSTFNQDLRTLTGDFQLIFHIFSLQIQFMKPESCLIAYQ